MVDCFRFPIAISHRGRMTHTYASVTGSILKTIRESGHGEFSGRPVCPPDGQFQIILYPGSDSGLGEHMYGKVRLLFSYPNLYLEGFSNTGGWYRYSDRPAYIVPGGVSLPLPFEAGYHNSGMRTNFMTLRFGKNTMPDIYKVLGAYPNNPGGIEEVQEALSKVCVLFPEAIRFPQLRCFLVFVMKWVATETVTKFSHRFQSWSPYCRAIRNGEQAFQPIRGTDVTTFVQLLSLVAVILYIA